MFFIAETKKSKGVKDWVSKTKERMLIDRFGINKMDIALQERPNDYYRIFIVAKPIMSNTMLYGAFLVLIPALLFGWGIWSAILIAALSSLKFFETNYFGFMLLKYALNKVGHTQPIIRVSLSQLVEEAIVNEPE